MYGNRSRPPISVLWDKIENCGFREDLHMESPMTSSDLLIFRKGLSGPAKQLDYPRPPSGLEIYTPNRASFKDLGYGLHQKSIEKKAS